MANVAGYAGGAGGFSLTTSGSMAVATVNGATGITTTSGPVTLTAGGSIAAGAIDAGASYAYLTAGTTVQQSPGDRIEADTVTVNAPGGVNLQGDNDFNAIYLYGASGSVLVNNARTAGASWRVDSASVSGSQDITLKSSNGANIVLAGLVEQTGTGE